MFAFSWAIASSASRIRRFSSLSRRLASAIWRSSSRIRRVSRRSSSWMAGSAEVGKAGEAMGWRNGSREDEGRPYVAFAFVRDVSKLGWGDMEA